MISEYYLPLGVISEYSGPGSIQMENTYIPCLLDGWATDSSTVSAKRRVFDIGGCLVLQMIYESACFLGWRFKCVVFLFDHGKVAS